MTSPRYPAVVEDGAPWIDYRDRAFVRQEILESLKRVANATWEEESGLLW